MNAQKDPTTAVRVAIEPQNEDRLDELIAAYRVHLAMWRHDRSPSHSLAAVRAGPFVSRFNEYDKPGQLEGMQLLLSYIANMLHRDWFMARLVEKVADAAPQKTADTTGASDYLPRSPVAKEPAPSPAAVFASRVARLTEAVAKMSDTEFDALMARFTAESQRADSKLPASPTSSPP